MLRSTKTKMGSWAPKASQGGKPGNYLGKSRKENLACKTCGIWFVGKHWTHPADVKEVKEQPVIRFIECPACRMKHDHMFEGEVLLRAVPQARKKEAIALVKHMGEKTFLRDPLHRILDMEDKGGVLRITTSENQLAVRIGKKIHSVFKGSLSIRWSKEDEVSRVIWEGPTAKPLLS